MSRLNGALEIAVPVTDHEGTEEYRRFVVEKAKAEQAAKAERAEQAATWIKAAVSIRPEDAVGGIA
jgi:hypothetical protein